MPDLPYVDLLGYIAASLTTLAFVPQALLVWRTDDTKAISLGMYCLTVTGIGLWFIYGLVIDSGPLIVANFITICLSGSILFKKVQHVRRGDA